MPVNIIQFERLAYLSFLVSMVAFVVENPTSGGQQLGLWGLITTIAIVTALAVALISGTARLRKNWLRWMFSTFLLVGVAADFWLIPNALAAGGNVTVQALTVFADVLDLVCIYLLFSAGSDAWFRRTAVAMA
jgi:hypothetical protein